MFTRSLAALLAFGSLLPSVFAAGPAAGDSQGLHRPAPTLGTPVTEAHAAAGNRNVFPDGQGLPAGRGTAVEGRTLFDRRCASCHGPGGRGATAEELAGERTPLDAPYPDKHIGNYWPYATTIFDFIRRAMPMDAPGSLDADAVYALTAYLLFANHIIAEHDEMNATTLPKVTMPNRDGFEWIDARP